MNNFVVKLNTLYYVFAPKFLDELRQKQERYPHIPQLTTILRDLNFYSQSEGITAIVRDNEENKRRLWIFIDLYYLEFYELNDGHDGYRLANIQVVNLYANNQLAQGYILIKAHWYQCEKPRGQNGIPQGSGSYWYNIIRVWTAMVQVNQNMRHQSSEQPIEALSDEHKEFLATVNDLIEETRRIEQEKHKNPVIITYSSFDRTAEEHVELRSIYVFHLVQKPQINARDMLRLTCNSERGRIFTLEDDRMTVKFEKAIDEMSIDPQGTFEVISSEVSFVAQQNAVDILQKQESNNQYLLKVLVDGIYQPYIPGHQRPEMTLNKSQHEAFQRAMAVPDLLLVLGPPGTGKTQTIQEIVKAYERQKQRILVTSRTNRAVDNALERLISDDLLVIRFGHEDSVSETMRGQLIDTQAKKLQQEILTKTNERAELLTQLISAGPYITKWINQLQKCEAELRQLEHQQQAANKQIQLITSSFQQKYQPVFGQFVSQLKIIESELNSCQQRFIKVDRRRQTLEHWRQLPVAGLMWTPLLSFTMQRWRSYQAKIQAYLIKRHDIQRAYEGEQQRMQHEIVNDPNHRYWSEQLKAYSIQYLQSQKQTHQVVVYLHHYIEKLTPDKLPVPITAQNMAGYINWYRQRYQLFERHYKLLSAWRESLEKRTKALYSELLRYADVIGTTCIGAATVESLSDASFDVAIVDEAGQINALDLLVPLVKAKRAILVGDHQQLPPFVDRNVQEWLKSLNANDDSSNTEEATDLSKTDLIKKSMFELLYNEQAYRENVVRLNRQYRMPAVIADYIAKQFYDSNLETDEKKAREVIFNDALFQKPLIFVDTADLEPRIRYDSSVEWINDRPGPVKGESIFNIREAELIARLACMYQHENTRWIVIVPYSAQAQHIRSLLATMPHMAGIDTEHLVATVDSFQGGESPVVIYGFTRSNPWKVVGFLSEVRRLNVAVTRAQQRLILVGDSQTLIINEQQQKKFQKAMRQNGLFYAMMSNLYNHTREHGQIVKSKVCLNRVNFVLDRNKQI